MALSRLGFLFLDFFALVIRAPFVIQKKKAPDGQEGIRPGGWGRFQDTGAACNLGKWYASRP